MASGKTHTQATTFTLTIGTLAGIWFVLNQHTTEALALAGGCWCGLVAGHLITPDVDHPDTTIEEGRFLRFLKPLGWAWMIFWRPYTWLFQHRGWSHTVPVGTLSRIIYLGMPAYLIYWSLGFPSVTVLHPREIITGFVVGWMLQDLVHLTLDGLLGSFLVPRR